jgi:hypothetical protein
VVRVRRSSDNLEANIGSVAGQLNTAALLGHCPANYLLQSETYAAAGWTRSNVSVAGKTLTSTATGATATGMSQVVTAPVGNTAYTLDILTSGTTSPWLRIAVTDGGVTPQSWINLATGVVGTVQAGITLTSTPIAGGYRVTLARTVVSASTTLFIRFADTDNSINSPAIGSTITIDRAWVNSGTTAGGYIATTTATTINSGFVATLYDISGNGRHFTQTTAASQPRIVNAGVVELEGGRPTLNYTAVGPFLTTPAIPGQNANGALIVVARAANTASARHPFGDRAGSGGGRIIRALSGGSAYFVANIDSGLSATLTGSTTQQRIISLLSSPTRFGGSLDGVVTAGGGGSYIASNGAFYLGGAGSISATGDWIGTISEAMVFTSDLSNTQRQAIERDQGAYFGITVP